MTVFIGMSTTHTPDEFLIWFRKTYKDGVEYPVKGDKTVRYDKLPADLRSWIFTRALQDYDDMRH